MEEGPSAQLCPLETQHKFIIPSLFASEFWPLSGKGNKSRWCGGGGGKPRRPRTQNPSTLSHFSGITEHIPFNGHTEKQRGQEGTKLLS